MIVKIFGYGFKLYFKNGWNLIDFLVVMVSIMEIVLEYQLPDSNDMGNIKLVKALRVFRIIRLLRHFEGMQD